MDTQRRLMGELPPGGSTKIENGSVVGSSVPVWFYWARIAQLQARMAAAARASDAARMQGVERGSSTNGRAPVDPVTGAIGRPDGAGMYLHWEGRRGYRTRTPAPRVLEPAPVLSFGEVQDSRIIEGDNPRPVAGFGDVQGSRRNLEV
jgi:hypothetical protein